MMNEIDNIEQIRELLTFDDEDKFYFIQIIKRRKENPTLKNNHKIIKMYDIANMGYFDSVMEEIKGMCEVHNARAYIHLNRRSYKKTAFQMLKKVSDQILNESYTSIPKAYNSVCAKFVSEPNKTWLIDIDYADISPFKYNSNREFIEEMKFLVTKAKTANKQDVVDIVEIPTRNGIHLIVSGFNLMYFNQANPTIKVDIHKNGPTILYIAN